MRVFWRFSWIGKRVLPLIVIAVLLLLPNGGSHGVRAQGTEPQITIVSPRDGEVEKAEVKATFDYQPAKPLPPVAGLNLGKPSVSILSPKNGATVSGQTFSLVFDVRNFRLSCDLLGRPKVNGTGHWHVNVDTTQGPMMGMLTMLAMGCSNTFEVPLAGIKPGTHKFFVLLVDNLHAPFSPAVEAAVTVNVRK